MTTRADIVREARSWIGTRWRHHQNTKRAGTDCVGMTAGVAVNVGLLSPDWKAIPDVQTVMGYGRVPFDGQLERITAKMLLTISESDAGPGDLVLMKWGTAPHHMAILGDYVHGGLSLIHAYAPRRCVCEMRLDETLRARIVSWHRFPGVDL